MNVMGKPKGSPLDDFIVRHYLILILAIIVLGMFFTVFVSFVDGLIIFFFLDIIWLVMVRKNMDRIEWPKMSKGVFIATTGSFMMVLILIFSLSNYIYYDTKQYTECSFLFGKFTNESNIFANKSKLKVNGSPDLLGNLTYSDIVYNKSLQEQYGWEWNDTGGGEEIGGWL